MAEPPMPIAMLLTTAGVAVLSGYMIGIASSFGYIPIPFMPQTSTLSSKDRIFSRQEESEEESSEEDIEVETSNLDHAPNWGNGLEADKRDGLRVEEKKTDEKSKEDGKVDKPSWEATATQEECKLVLVVRTDLGMTKGKIAAQCSHATLACYKNFLKSKPNSPTLRRWERQGQAKVALKVENEDELLLLQARTISLGLVGEVIADAGRTQIASGSHTVLGIGPGPKSVVDQVTGHLKLL